MEIDHSRVDHFRQGNFFDIDIQSTAVGEHTGKDGFFSINGESTAVGDLVEHDTLNCDVEVAFVHNLTIEETDCINSE